MTERLALKRPPATYRGRFAPSPSGPLHFGSLLAALGSYLDARSQAGTWLVRIEDIDPPREQAGADSLILHALEQFGLHWDETVLYQSSRLAAYEEQLIELQQQQAAYHCDCSRKRIKTIGGHYDGHCRQLNVNQPPYATRFYHPESITHFTDLRLGEIELMPPWDQQDFIIKRRDGLVAYQLAVVMDDLFQNINHVVRGVDLLETTGWQLALYRHWQQPAPAYLHLPLALDPQGNKLSKQNHATAINAEHPQPELCLALHCLGLTVPSSLQQAPVNEIINWAVAHWQRATLGRSNHINMA